MNQNIPDEWACRIMHCVTGSLVSYGHHGVMVAQSPMYTKGDHLLQYPTILPLHADGADTDVVGRLSGSYEVCGDLSLQVIPIDDWFIHRTLVLAVDYTFCEGFDNSVEVWLPWHNRAKGQQHTKQQYGISRLPMPREDGLNYSIPCKKHADANDHITSDTILCLQCWKSGG